MKEQHQTIPVYVGAPFGGTDPRVHFWYHPVDGETRRICDDAVWPEGKPPRLDDSGVYVPCNNCKGLFADNILYGKQQFDPHPYIDASQNFVVYSHKTRESNGQLLGGTMDIQPIAISTFARYHEATDQQKWRIVQEVLAPRRDFYWALRNTLAETHWQSNDISTFEAALDGLLESLKSPAQRVHYETLARNYVAFWKERPGAQVFPVRTVETKIAGLPIKVNHEIGMAFGSDQLALKFYLRAAPPSKKYRQAIQHITDKAKQHGWNPSWQPVLVDVRRKDRLPPIPLPRNFDLVLEAHAVSFLHTWERLQQQAAVREL